MYIKNATDIQWANSSVVGDSIYKTYEELDVIIDISALSAFSTYMRSKTFPFTYDQATALVSKDLWAPYFSNLTPKDRSRFIGIAYVSTICNDQPFAIIEQFGGFQFLIFSCRISLYVILYHSIS